MNLSHPMILKPAILPAGFFMFLLFGFNFFALWLNFLNMKYIILLLFTIQLSTSSLFSQKWIENDVTEFFEFKHISDVCFQKDVAWILSGDGIYKYKDAKFEFYRIDTLASGPIEQFKVEPKRQNDYQFSSLAGNDSVIWIVATYGKTILKIQNDTITNYKPEFLKESFYAFQNYCIDEKGYLWFDYSVRDTAKVSNSTYTSTIDKIGYFNGTEFSEFLIPSSLTKNVFSAFAVNKSVMYFIGFRNLKYSSENSTYLYTLKGANLDSIVIDMKPSSRPAIFILNDTMFVYTTGKVVSILFDNRIIDTLSNIDIGLSFQSDLFVLNEFLFITSGKGLFVYNRNNDKHKITKPFNFADNCLSEFDAIRYRKVTNQLWCLYGGAYITDRFDYCSYGLSIYQLK